MQDIKIFTLENGKGMEVALTNYGGRVMKILVPDKEGEIGDVVLGFDTLEEYREHPDTYFGAVIGRVSNRIAKGTFELDGKMYQLEQNNEQNALHGGSGGFHNVVWEVLEADREHVALKYVSPDGEEGYPGTLTVKMTYTLTEKNEFKIDYEAETDARTVVNLTHHSFFNLSGEGYRDVMDHELQLNGSAFVPLDENLIPTGEIRSVENTPMDFRSPEGIGTRIDGMDDQLGFAGGYDHTWVLDKKDGELALAATVFAPATGRKMEVLTTEPGIQFYSGNFLDGSVNGKEGKNYAYRSAFCLESQHFPDSPNQADFPSTVLEPGETYRHSCVYRFSVEK
jgi:aldose 1-epimerase